MAVSATAGADEIRSEFSTGQWAALLIVVCTAFSSQMVMPLWVGAVIDDFNLPPDAAGRIGSFEFLAVAAVSVLVALKIKAFPTIATVGIGMLLLTVGNLSSAFASSELYLIGARVVCGIGKGMVVAITFSLVAGSPRPTRAFALLNTMYAVFATGFYLTIPIAINWDGATGAFLTMAAVAAVGAICMLGYPRVRLNASQITGISLVKIPRFGLWAFVALIALWTGHNVIWTFVERVGVRVGLDVTSIGGVLSVAAFLTIAGPALARIIDTRFGFGAPMLIAVSLKTAAVFLLIYVAQPWLYSIAVPAFLLLSLFITPYIMGMLSLADPAGRLAAASSAAMTAGGSLGAFLGGATIAEFGYEGLAWVAGTLFLIFTVITALTAPVASRYGKAAAEGQSVPEEQP